MQEPHLIVELLLKDSFNVTSLDITKYFQCQNVCAGDVTECDKRTEHADKELGQRTNARWDRYVPIYI